MRDRRRARGAPGGGVTAPDPSGAGDDVSIEDDSGAPAAPDDAVPDGGAGGPEPDEGSDPEVPIEDPGADPA